MESRRIGSLSPGRMAGCVAFALALGLLLPIVALFQISMLVPVLMLCGIAAAFLHARAGWLPTGLLYAAALGSTLWFFGLRIMLLVLAAAVLPSLVVIRGVAAKQPFFRQMSLGIAAYAAGLVAAVLAAYAAFGGNMVAKIMDVLRQEFQRMPDAALQPFADAVSSALAMSGLQREGGFTVEMYRAQLSGVLDLMQQTYAQALPGTLLTGAMLSGVLSVFWGNWTMARHGMATNESFIGMSRWFLPGQVTGGAVALWAASFLVSRSSYSAGATVYVTVAEAAGAVFVIQALSAIDRRMLTADRGVGRRRVLIALLSVGALIFRGIATLLCAMGVISALFGSHGAVRLWLESRQNDHSDRDDPDE